MHFWSFLRLKGFINSSGNQDITRLYCLAATEFSDLQCLISIQGELVYIQKLLFLTIISFVSMSSMFKSGLRVNLQLQQVTKTISPYNMNTI